MPTPVSLFTGLPRRCAFSAPESELNVEADGLLDDDAAGGVRKALIDPCRTPCVCVSSCPCVDPSTVWGSRRFLVAIVDSGCVKVLLNPTNGLLAGFLTLDEGPEVWIHLDGSGRKGIEDRGFCSSVLDPVHIQDHPLGRTYLVRIGVHLHLCSDISLTTQGTEQGH